MAGPMLLRLDLMLYSCKYCGKEFPQVRNYLGHLMRKHGLNLEDLRNEVGPEEQERFKL